MNRSQKKSHKERYMTYIKYTIYKANKRSKKKKRQRNTHKKINSNIETNSLTKLLSYILP